MSPYDGDPIVAAATPPGTSGIAVFRVSGQGAAELVDPLLHVSQDGFPEYAGVPAMSGYTCVFAHLHDPVDGRFLDEAVVTRFRAPRSYTGEDVVELAVHGGPAVRRAVMSALCAAGARPAEPGEFTRRAFLNGKLDLARAEAVMDLISSEAERSRSAAAEQLRGAVSEAVGVLRDELFALLASIELSIEYPEHEESDEASRRLLSGVASVADRLAALVATFRTGRMLREGMGVVIAGRPNAGKSSLLNRLAGYDRAIVSEVPGTTRDTIEETVGIAGLPVRLVDTAGLRESEDSVERQGVDRARGALATADAVLWVVAPQDSDLELAAEIEEALRSAAGLPIAFVAGKNDLPESLGFAGRIRAALVAPHGTGATHSGAAGIRAIPVLPFSALTGEGLDAVAAFLVSLVEEGGAERRSEAVLTNARHHRAASAALDRLVEVRDGLPRGLPLDVASAVLRDAASHLSEITGDEVSESLVAEIFARFCVGK
jgi:tRNA modification GTPase